MAENIKLRAKKASKWVLPHLLLQYSLQEAGVHGSPARPYIVRLSAFRRLICPFRLAAAPWLSNRISHRVDVSLRRSSKTLHRVEARLLRVFQPDAELANILAFEQALKSHGEATHCGELWPVRFHRIDFCGLTGGQQYTLLDAERRGNDRRDRSSGCKINYPFKATLRGELCRLAFADPDKARAVGARSVHVICPIGAAQT